MDALFFEVGFALITNAAITVPQGSTAFWARTNIFSTAQIRCTRVDRKLIALRSITHGMDAANGFGHILVYFFVRAINIPRRIIMPTVTKPAHVKGDFLDNYEEKVFEDVKADSGEKALVTFHTVAF